MPTKEKRRRKWVKMREGRRRTLAKVTLAMLAIIWLAELADTHPIVKKKEIANELISDSIESVDFDKESRSVNNTDYELKSIESNDNARRSAEHQNSRNINNNNSNINVNTKRRSEPGQIGITTNAILGRKSTSSSSSSNRSSSKSKSKTENSNSKMPFDPVLYLSKYGYLDKTNHAKHGSLVMLSSGI